MSGYSSATRRSSPRPSRVSRPYPSRLPPRRRQRPEHRKSLSVRRRLSHRAGSPRSRRAVRPSERGASGASIGSMRCVNGTARDIRAAGSPRTWACRGAPCDATCEAVRVPTGGRGGGARHGSTSTATGSTPAWQRGMRTRRTYSDDWVSGDIEAPTAACGDTSRSGWVWRGGHVPASMRRSLDPATPVSEAAVVRVGAAARGP